MCLLVFHVCYSYTPGELRSARNLKGAISPNAIKGRLLNLKSSVVRQFVFAKTTRDRSSNVSVSARAVEGDGACCVARNYITVISARWISHGAAASELRKCVLKEVTCEPR